MIKTGARAELCPFELALLAAADERAFNRTTPLFARKRLVERAGLFIGTGDDFTGFVAEQSLQLADRFLSNFDPTRRGASLKATRYLQMTAVSNFLSKRVKAAHSERSDLATYLRTSKRLSARTKLAIKLAYLPALLSHEERIVLKSGMGSGAYRAE